MCSGSEVWVCVCYGPHVEIRGQAAGVGSLLPPCQSWNNQPFGQPQRQDVIIMADGNLGWVEMWRLEETAANFQITEEGNGRGGGQVWFGGDSYFLRFTVRVKSGPNIIFSGIKRSQRDGGVNSNHSGSRWKKACSAKDIEERNNASNRGTWQLGLHIKMLFICDLHLQCPQ